MESRKGCRLEAAGEESHTKVDHHKSRSSLRILVYKPNMWPLYHRASCVRLNQLADQMFILDRTSSLKKLQEQDTLVLSREVDTPVSFWKPIWQNRGNGISVCPKHTCTHIHNHTRILLWSQYNINPGALCLNLRLKIYSKMSLNTNTIFCILIFFEIQCVGKWIY